MACERDFKINHFSWQRAVQLLLIFLLVAGCAASRRAKLRARQVEEVIQTARSYIGTPYKYGGTTRSGMDCSGLLINSYRVINITLPRESDSQATMGEKVKLKKVQPGDLVFFATGKRRRKITHVGMVTEVRSDENVKFIHASSSVGVIETNLYADYFIKRFRLARRILD